MHRMNIYVWFKYYTEIYGEMKMRKAVFAAGIAGVGLLSGCMGGATTTPTATPTPATPTVLKSNSAASGSGYLTLTNNGTIETLVARGIDVDDITLEPAVVTLNSLNLVDDFGFTRSDTTLYTGSVDINGTTVSGYVMTGKNQTTAQAIMPTNLIGATFTSGSGQVVSSMPTGTHTYNGNTILTRDTESAGVVRVAVSNPMSVVLDLSLGKGLITLPTHTGTTFVETLALNSQNGSFNGIGGVDNNGEVFTTFGNIVGQNGEAVVGVFDGISEFGDQFLDLTGGYVAER